MTPVVIIAFLGLCFTWVMSFAGVIVWAVRLEGRVNLVTVRSDGHDKRDDALQRQIEDFRSHTEVKIDKLGEEMARRLDRIDSKLDSKMDKDAG